MTICETDALELQNPILRLIVKSPTNLLLVVHKPRRGIRRHGLKTKHQLLNRVSYGEFIR